jgi:DNA repair exonuclease SbcCD ATPase subunit
MDGTSLEKKLAWIDEQRRKEAEVIRRLSERVEAAEEANGRLARQLQDLSTEMSRLAAATTRISQLDETLTKHRNEVSRQLEAAEARRSERDRQLEQVRRKDHDDTAKAISELRQQVRAIDEVRRVVDSRREEEVRLSRAVDSFSKQLDKLAASDEERGRVLEGQDQLRRQEAKRASELVTDIADVRNRAESVRGSLDHLDDRIRSLEVRQAEIESAEGERREAQNVFLEQQSVRMVEFERLWKEYARRFDTFESQARDLADRVLVYEETYRSLKQLQADLDKALERMDRHVGEVVESQRLAEDRHRQEWAGFQAEDQKRWNTFKLAHDEHWREHDRRHEKHVSEIEQLEKTASQALTEAIQNGDALQRRTAELLSLLRDWALETERPPGRVSS